MRKLESGGIMRGIDGCRNVGRNTRGVPTELCTNMSEHARRVPTYISIIMGFPNQEATNHHERQRIQSTSRQRVIAH